MSYFSVFSIWGYVDLRLTLSTFDDASRKITNIQEVQKDIKSGKSTFSKINFVSSKYADLDCFKVVMEMIESTMIPSLDNNEKKNFDY